MKKIAFTLVTFFTTISLFGCTSNNNQSTPPPVSPPLNEIYFAGYNIIGSNNKYEFYFNYTHAGNSNLLWNKYILTSYGHDNRRNNTTYYNGYCVYGYDSYGTSHFDDHPTWISPYSTITIAVDIDTPQIINVRLLKITNFYTYDAEIITSKDFDLASLIKTTNSFYFR